MKKTERILCDHCGYPVTEHLVVFDGQAADGEGVVLYEVGLRLHRQCLYYLIHIHNDFIRFGEMSK